MSETLALTELGVVLEGRASDSRSERVDGSKTEGSSLLGSRYSSRLLGTGLVEPDLDSPLPVLSEMVVVEDVVVTETHWKRRKRGKV